jgi:formaldehyde-activating enzyme involved in methanogenesis
LFVDLVIFPHQSVIHSSFQEALRNKLSAGSTAVVALLIHDQILGANVGD